MGSKAKYSILSLLFLILILLLVLSKWGLKDPSPVPSGPRSPFTKGVTLHREKEGKPAGERERVTHETDGKEEGAAPKESFLHQCVITGTVKDYENDLPIPQAEILCREARDGKEWTDRVVKTDEGGAFTITGILPSARVVLQARADGFAAERSELLLRGKSVEENFCLKPGATLKGRALRADGESLEEFTINVKPQYSREAVYTSQIEREEWDVFAKVTYEEDGQFTVHNLVEYFGEYFEYILGKYALIGQSPGYVPVVLEPVYGGSTGVKLVFHSNGASIKGTVRDEETRESLSGVLVRLFSFDFMKEACTEEGGSFLFSGLPPGEFMIRVEPDVKGQRLASIVEVSLKEMEEIRSVNLLCRKGMEISGRVTDRETGNALPDIPLQCKASFLTGGIENEKAESDGEGNFAFKGPFEEGKYSFCFFDKNQAPVPIDEILIDQQLKDRVELQIWPQGQVCGVVLNPSLQPMRDIWVAAFPFEYPRKSLRWAKTDAEGRFSFYNLSPGEHSLEAKSKTYVSEADSVRVIVGERTSTRDLVIQLKRGVSVFGRVTDTRGMPLGKRRLVCRPWVNAESSRYGREDYAVTDKRGFYRFDGIGIECVEISIHMETDFSMKKILSLNLQETEVRQDFCVPVFLPISGHVVDLHGTPIRMAQIGLTSEGNERAYYRNYYAFADKNGFFQEMVPEGRYTLEAEYYCGEWADYESYEKKIKSVVAGTEDMHIVLDLVIPVKKRAIIEGTVLDARTKNPVAKAMISSEEDFTYTRGDGSFRLEVEFLGNPELLVCAEHEDYVSSFLESLIVEEGERKSDIVILMEKEGIELEVTVLDEEGNPVEFAHVHVGSRLYPLSKYERTNSSGMVLLDQINPHGGDLISVEKHGYYSKSRGIQREEAIAGKVTIKIEKTGR